MSSYLMHTDPTVYEEPFEFVPERWLGAVHPNMNRNFVPFSRGSRNCLGMKYVLILSSLYSLWEVGSASINKVARI